MNEGATNIQVLGEIRTGPEMVLQVRSGDYRSRPYVYLQLASKLEGEVGDGEPTNRGLTLNLNTLRQLLPMLERALEASSSRRVPDRGRNAGEEALLDAEARDRRRL